MTLSALYCGDSHVDQTSLFLKGVTPEMSLVVQQESQSMHFCDDGCRDF